MQIIKCISNTSEEGEISLRCGYVRNFIAQRVQLLITVDKNVPEIIFFSQYYENLVRRQQCIIIKLKN